MALRSIAANGLTDLVDQILMKAYEPPDGCMERLELFLHSSRYGTAAIEGILLMQRARENPSSVLTSEAIDKLIPTEGLADTGLFCAYMMLSQQRRMKASMIDESVKMRPVDYMTDALEFFALYENRAYPKLLEIERLIRRKESQAK